MDDQERKAKDNLNDSADKRAEKLDPKVRRPEDLDHPDEMREALRERSRDRADGRFDGVEDYRGERREAKAVREAYELMSISPEADHVHDWGVFQFIASVVVALGIIVYMSIGQREVFFEGMNPYFFDWLRFYRGFILGVLLVLASNTVRIWSNSLSIIVEASFRHILVDEENEIDQPSNVNPTSKD